MTNDKRKNNNKFFLIIIISLLILIPIIFIIFLNIDKSINTNKEKEFKYHKLTCIVKDISKEDGQEFTYKFIFNNKNDEIKSIDFIGNYPQMEDGLTKEEIETLANSYMDYFCNDKLIKSDTCQKEVLSNNHIELKFSIRPEEYLNTYNISISKDITLLDGLKNYYENRKEDSCEEVFTVSNKSCEEKFSSKCNVE